MPMTSARPLRLSHHLLLTTALSALLAMLVTMGVLLGVEHARALAQLERGVDTGARILRGQVIGLAEGASLEARFPDWSALTAVTRSDGSCFKLEHPNGQPWHSDCRGGASGGDAAPRWFADGYRVVFSPARRITRDIARGREVLARLALSSDGEAEIADNWRQAQRMATLGAVLLVTLVLALSFFTARALRPLHAIVAMLEALARGERNTQHASAAHVELQRITRAGATLAATLDGLEQQRAHLSLRLLEVQDHERRQLARDLHDEFGQHLAALAATIASVRRTLAPELHALHDALERSTDSVAHLQAMVREVLARLRPPGIDELGLCAAVHALAADWQRRCAGRPQVQAHCDPCFDALPAPLAAEILRVVQECTTNAVRHAEAGLIVITLARSERSFDVEISDDGRGVGESAPGAGLQGVRERAAACAGHLDIQHGVNGGLVIKLGLPAAHLESVS